MKKGLVKRAGAAKGYSLSGAAKGFGLKSGVNERP